MQKNIVFERAYLAPSKPYVGPSIHYLTMLINHVLQNRIIMLGPIPATATGWRPASRCR